MGFAGKIVASQSASPGGDGMMADEDSDPEPMVAPQVPVRDCFAGYGQAA
jgi:hypothetical protein